MKVGYARVSTTDQNLDLQIDALKQQGCHKIFEEKITASTLDRPKLTEALNYVREGDIIVVWKLDRLGRSLKDLIEIVNDLENRNIGLQTCHENIDTTTAVGRLIFHIFGALAEFERNILKERTMAGLESARARGRMGGRPHKLKDEKIVQLKALYASKLPIREILKTFKISKRTLYCYLSDSITT